MDSKLLRSEELGIKLEIVDGLPIWEASPVMRHQLAVDRIRKSIKRIEANGKTCDCFHVADIYVEFPDGSLKRPDISIFVQRRTKPMKPSRKFPMPLSKLSARVTRKRFGNRRSVLSGERRERRGCYESLY